MLIYVNSTDQLCVFPIWHVMPIIPISIKKVSPLTIERADFFVSVRDEAYLRLGLSSLHFSTGGRTPMAITSSRILQRCS